MQLHSKSSRAWSAFALSAAFLLAGCSVASTAEPAPHPTTAPPTVPPLTAQIPQKPDEPGNGQTTFATDEDAASAFVAAVAADDHDKVHQILGPQWKELLTGDKVQDANAFKDFATHAAEHHQLEMKNADLVILDIGNNDWPFPIPIVRTDNGKWFFDTLAGKAEILARHIGADELGAIDVCRAYVRAQREYYRTPHEDDLLEYAQRILSKPGTEDGLYYPVAAGQTESPFGPLIADAEMEGYPAPENTPQSPERHPPYHGYHFRILKAQGADAPGGAYSYIINGHMLAGFALVAFPDKYGSSGIMTFVINQRGKVYQKDLGPNTTDLARHVTDYNPDSTWALEQE
ncbi:MAG TPA: DUF2950 domain-containing protein [Tepidisphaeraceae bacterium]|jgi:hypothetical protein|nr:DUF2950 domain-containing protein [Tepidisphaeraceae bacterium]